MQEISEQLFKTKLGQEIKKIRKSLNLSQETVAERSLISIDFLYKLEIGYSSPTSLRLVQIANALEITPNDLLEEFIDNKDKVIEDSFLREMNKLTEKDKEIILQLVKHIISIKEKM